MEVQQKVRSLSNPEEGGRKWYQYFDFGNGVTTGHGGRAKYRTDSFIEFLDKTDIGKNDRLLDIGSNAGLFCLVCGPKCADVIGIEFDEAFHRQALFLKEYFDAQGRDTSNVRLIHGDVTKHLDLFKDRTVVFASKVLYHKHLGDGVFQLMEAIRKAPVRMVVVQGHTTQGERGQNDGMRELFARYGFTYRVEFDHEEYPIGLALRTAG